MFGKPKKSNKADGVAVEEEKPLEATEDLLIEDTVTAAPAKTEKKSEKVEEEKPVRKSAQKKEEPKKSSSGTVEISLKHADPIILISAIVFFAACFVVIGATIYDVTLADHSQPVAEYGNEVTVDYTGSYFNYYDKGGVVFDTSLSSVANDNNYLKSYEFTKKDSYSSITFTIGEGEYLAKFETALINHRPGETIRVAIDAKDGYGTLTEGVDQFTGVKTGQTVPVVNRYTSEEFKSFYETDVPASGSIVESPYGWNARVTVDGTGFVLTQFDSVTVGETYEMNSDVSLKVDSIGIVGDKECITFTYIINDFKLDADMVKAIVDGETVYVIKSSGNEMVYKTTEEKVGAKLYFVIKFIEYAKD